MKQAYLAQNPVDAQLAADALRAAGINVLVKVAAFDAPLTPFPSVWVEDEDLPRAVKLLRGRADSAYGAV